MSSWLEFALGLEGYEHVVAGLPDDRAVRNGEPNDVASGELLVPRLDEVAVDSEFEDCFVAHGCITPVEVTVMCLPSGPLGPRGRAVRHRSTPVGAGQISVPV